MNPLERQELESLRLVHNSLIESHLEVTTYQEFLAPLPSAIRMALVEVDRRMMRLAQGCAERHFCDAPGEPVCPECARVAECLTALVNEREK